MKAVWRTVLLALCELKETVIVKFCSRSVRGLWLSLCCTLLVACGGGGDPTSTAVSASGSTAGTAVASIRVTPETAQIAVTASVTLSAQALDPSGAVVSGQSFSFNSSNPTVAAVTDSASPFSVTIKGVSNGVATITVTAAGKTASAVITVRGQPDIQLSGRVIDGLTQAGLAGARVELENGTAAVTGSDGAYSIAVPFSGNGSDTFVSFRASHAGYLPTDLSVTVTPATTTVETILLVPPNSVPGSISGSVRDATTTSNAGIPGAAITLSKGQGEAGLFVSETKSDAGGGYSFTGLEAGVYIIRVVASRYSNCGRTVIPLQASANTVQNVVCSPIGSTPAIRVVLTWGSNPRDLDAHLTGPNVSDAGRFHVFYPSTSRGNSDNAPFAKLDVDNTSGFGPETITITRMNSGVYRYSVHDYTNRSSATSTELGSSGAKVELYLPSGELSGPRTFYVPNARGNLWVVFELSGSLTNPTVSPRNEMTLAPEQEVNIP